MSNLKKRQEWQNALVYIRLKKLYNLCSIWRSLSLDPPDYCYRLRWNDKSAHQNKKINLKNSSRCLTIKNSPLHIKLTQEPDSETWILLKTRLIAQKLNKSNTRATWCSVMHQLCSRLCQRGVGSPLWSFWLSFVLHLCRVRLHCKVQLIFF